MYGIKCAGMIVTKSMSHVTIKRHKSQTYDMDGVAILSTDFLPYVYIYIYKLKSAFKQMGAIL